MFKFYDTGANWMVEGMCATERGGEWLKHIYSCVKHFKIEVRLGILAEAELSVLHILKVKPWVQKNVLLINAELLFENVWNFILRAKSLIPFSRESSLHPAWLGIFIP